MYRLAGMLCGAAVCAVAQVQIEDLGAEVRSGSPLGVSLSVRMTDNKVFREGELIPIEVEFRHPMAAVPESPETIYQFAGVLLDPGPGCGDVSHPCRHTSLATFSARDPMLSINERAGPFPTDLNLYIPKLKPGKYRAALLAQELVLRAIPPWSQSYGYPDPRRYAVSNTVEFEIQSASEEWIAKSIQDARAILSKPPALTSDDYLQRQKAARALSFVQGQDAWQASLDYGVFEGLIEADNQKAVCRLMQNRLKDPGQPVSSAYLQNMGQICERAEFPVTQPFDQTTAEGKQQAREWVLKTNAFRSALLDRATDTLAASLDRRRSAVRDTAIQALIYQALSISNNEPAHPNPAWLPHLRSYVVQNFFNLETQLQGSLLGGYWTAVRGTEMVPLLETILDREPTDYVNLEMWRVAIKRLCEMDPVKGRARLLTEIRRRDTRVDERTLSLLPSKDVPAMDSELIETLAAAQRPFGGGNYRMVMTIIARYATPEALPRIKSIYESQQDPCQPELMAYFLRVDPAYADNIFHSRPWDMLKPPPECTTRYFETTSRIYMHPVLEGYMSAYLMRGIVGVKRAAAVALGKYGSKNAEVTLWEAFRYFHEYWKDHPHELPVMGEGASLENDLRDAIARSKSWVASEASLRMLQSLCITRRCQYETENDVRAWTPFVRVGINSGDDFRATVAQYYGIDSITSLESKLEQFPRGTQFRLQVWGPDREAITTKLIQFTGGSGIAPAR